MKEPKQYDVFGTKVTIKEITIALNVSTQTVYNALTKGHTLESYCRSKGVSSREMLLDRLQDAKQKQKCAEDIMGAIYGEEKAREYYEEKERKQGMKEEEIEKKLEVQSVSEAQPMVIDDRSCESESASAEEEPVEEEEIEEEEEMTMEKIEELAPLPKLEELVPEAAKKQKKGGKRYLEAIADTISALRELSEAASEYGDYEIMDHADGFAMDLKDVRYDIVDKLIGWDRIAEMLD